MNQRKKLHDNTEKEVSLWRLLGLTLPFVGMTAIIMCVLFANNYVVHVTVAIVMIWITVAVYWWWWALYKIARISKLMLTTGIRFEEVKKELIELRDDLGNRQRPKQTKRKTR